MTEAYLNEIKLLDRIEKAKELKISYRTLSRWIKLNKIAYYKAGYSKKIWFIPEEKI